MDTTPEQRLRALCDEAQAGCSPQMVLFYGHSPSSPEPGPGCLSQWWRAPFMLDGRNFPTAEHAMMAGKARLFGDTRAEQAIMAALTPRQAKFLGRQVEPFVQDRWEAEAFGIVVAANLAKFAQNPNLSRYLVGTGTAVLVEASPLDRVWGIGLGRSDPRAQDPRQWVGTNLLGFALMEVRSRLSTAGTQ